MSSKNSTVPAPAAKASIFWLVDAKASAGTILRSVSRTMFHSFTLSAPNRMTARELCELNAEGVSRIASRISASTSAVGIGRVLVSA